MQRGRKGEGELGRYYCDLNYEIPTTALVCVISELTPNNKQNLLLAFLLLVTSLLRVSDLNTKLRI